MVCEHRRIKKSFPFGHKSRPKMFCKDCGEIITRKMLEKKRKDKEKRNKFR